MWDDVLFRRMSLKTRLILSYLVILGIGGLATSLVGSWIVSSTIMRQARQTVEHDLATVRTVYEGELSALERTVRLASSGPSFSEHLADGNTAVLLDYLERVHHESGFDFLTLTDRDGTVVVRASQPGRVGDNLDSIGVIAEALDGETTAATEILGPDRLRNEDPRLAARAVTRVVKTPRSGPAVPPEETAGMVLLAAAPVRAADGRVLGALYAGKLLNHSYGIVDRVWELLYHGDRYQNEDVGTVTIFQGDVRISTNVISGQDERAVGTRVSDEVRRTVLGEGEIWIDRAFAVDDWYISAYEPILNHDGAAVGILSVGILETTYTATRDRVILSFFGIAGLGYILIIGITYTMIRSITRPIGEMVDATRSITAGRFDQEVDAGSQGEIALLANSFNTMLKSLRQMKSDLEEWARTLEEKVKERTEELLAMQARVAQSERLASVGMLAAGVAHEINNPLGGILALTALTLEDIPADSPDRENLEEVIKQTERCRDIVKGLLEFSRQSEVHTEPVDLNRILEETLALISRQSIFLNIEVVKELDPDLPEVMADRSQFQQVFMNIIMNAVQAMEEKGRVTLVTRRAGEDRVEILISDTGRGIPAEKIDRIFDPFFTTKASGQGTGLGLSIAYGIVSKHRGTITVESEEGRGSTFTIRVPAAP